MNKETIEKITILFGELQEEENIEKCLDATHETNLNIKIPNYTRLIRITVSGENEKDSSWYDIPEGAQKPLLRAFKSALKKDIGETITELEELIKEIKA